MEPASQQQQGEQITEYPTVDDDVVPYVARVGGELFRFIHRPSADLQLDLARISKEQLGAAHVEFIRNILAAMLEEPDDVDKLLRRMDLRSVSRLINDAVRHMSGRDDTPTIGLPDSSSGQPDPTSATGS